MPSINGSRHCTSRTTTKTTTKRPKGENSWTSLAKRETISAAGDKPLTNHKRDAHFATNLATKALQLQGATSVWLVFRVLLPAPHEPTRNVPASVLCCASLTVILVGAVGLVGVLSSSAMTCFSRPRGRSAVGAKHQHDPPHKAEDGQRRQRHAEHRSLETFHRNAEDCALVSSVHVATDTLNFEIGTSRKAF